MPSPSDQFPDPWNQRPRDDSDDSPQQETDSESDNRDDDFGLGELRELLYGSDDLESPEPSESPRPSESVFEELESLFPSDSSSQSSASETSVDEELDSLMASLGLGAETRAEDAPSDYSESILEEELDSISELEATAQSSEPSLPVESELGLSESELSELERLGDVPGETRSEESVVMPPLGLDAGARSSIEDTPPAIDNPELESGQPDSEFLVNTSELAQPELELEAEPPESEGMVPQDVEPLIPDAASPGDEEFLPALSAENTISGTSEISDTEPLETDESSPAVGNDPTSDDLADQVVSRSGDETLLSQDDLPESLLGESPEPADEVLSPPSDSLIPPSVSGPEVSETEEISPIAEEIEKTEEFNIPVVPPTSTEVSSTPADTGRDDSAPSDPEPSGSEPEPAPASSDSEGESLVGAGVSSASEVPVTGSTPSMDPMTSSTGPSTYRQILSGRQQISAFALVLAGMGGVMGYGWSKAGIDNPFGTDLSEPGIALFADQDKDSEEQQPAVDDSSQSSIQANEQFDGEKQPQDQAKGRFVVPVTPSTHQDGSAKTALIAPSLDDDSEQNEESQASKSSEPDNQQDVELQTPPPIDISDVPPDHWARPYVEAMYQQGVIPDFPDGQFQPDKPVTRAELAASIQRAFKDGSDVGSIPFTDIPEGYWAKDAITHAVNTGFMSGYSEEIFKPNQNIPRYQVLVSLVSGLGLGKIEDTQEASALLQKFPDVESMPKWALGQVAASEKADLIVNQPQDGTGLSPARPATRAEVSAMIYQALVNAGKIEDTVK